MSCKSCFNRFSGRRPVVYLPFKIERIKCTTVVLHFLFFYSLLFKLNQSKYRSQFIRLKRIVFSYFFFILKIGFIASDVILVGFRHDIIFVQRLIPRARVRAVYPAEVVLEEEGFSPDVEIRILLNGTFAVILYHSDVQVMLKLGLELVVRPVYCTRCPESPPGLIFFFLFFVEMPAQKFILNNTI